MGGDLPAVDLETGEVAWRVTLEDAVSSSPAVVGGRIFVGSKDGRRYAFAAG